MKTRSFGEMILAALFLGFFAVMIGIGLTYGPKARRLPLVVMVPGLALAGVNLVKVTRGRAVPEASEDVDGAEGAGEGGNGEGARVLRMIGWIVLLVLSIWLLGFLTTIPLYTLLFMRVMGESWKLSALCAVFGLGVLYFLFVTTLHIELYPGLLFRP